MHANNNTTTLGGSTTFSVKSMLKLQKSFLLAVWIFWESTEYIYIYIMCGCHLHIIHEFIAISLCIIN